MLKDVVLQNNHQIDHKMQCRAKNQLFDLRNYTLLGFKHWSKKGRLMICSKELL